jgi:hypothetical protein
MSFQHSLFGEDNLESSPSPTTIPADQRKIADWQVEQLRLALDACGLEDMTERQHLMESLVGRPVPSLRDVRASEVRVLLEELKLKAAPAKARSRGSSWDNREGDTWIDRL